MHLSVKYNENKKYNFKLSFSKTKSTTQASIIKSIVNVVLP